MGDEDERRARLEAQVASGRADASFPDPDLAALGAGESKSAGGAQSPEQVLDAARRTLEPVRPWRSGDSVDEEPGEAKEFDPGTARPGTSRTLDPTRPWQPRPPAQPQEMQAAGTGDQGGLTAPAAEVGSASRVLQPVRPWLRRAVNPDRRSRSGAPGREPDSRAQPPATGDEPEPRLIARTTADTPEGALEPEMAVHQPSRRDRRRSRRFAAGEQGPVTRQPRPRHAAGPRQPVQSGTAPVSPFETLRAPERPSVASQPIPADIAGSSTSDPPGTDGGRRFASAATASFPLEAEMAEPAEPPRVGRGKDRVRRLAAANAVAMERARSTPPADRPTEDESAPERAVEPRRQRGVKAFGPASGAQRPAGRRRRLDEAFPHVPGEAAAGTKAQPPADEKPAAGTASPRPHRVAVRALRRLGVMAAIAVLAAFLLRTYVAASYYIPSASMEPTLHGCEGCNNDHVLVDKLSYRLHDIRRGDVVVFRRSKTWPVAEKVLIKRVIGLPGDTLTTRNGVVYVNGLALQEPYLNSACPGGTVNFLKPVTVPDGYAFVMGDNRCDSSDSRRFGPIADSSVIGRAFVIIWPFGRVHWL